MGLLDGLNLGGALRGALGEVEAAALLMGLETDAIAAKHAINAIASKWDFVLFFLFMASRLNLELFQCSLPDLIARGHSPRMRAGYAANVLVAQREVA